MINWSSVGVAGTDQPLNHPPLGFAALEVPGLLAGTDSTDTQ